MEIKNEKSRLVKLEMTVEDAEGDGPFGYIIVPTNDRALLDAGRGVVKSAACGWNCKNGVSLRGE